MTFSLLPRLAAYQLFREFQSRNIDRRKHLEQFAPGVLTIKFRPGRL